MLAKNVFIQLTSAGLDTGNFTITDCNGNVVLLGEIGGGSLPNATNISRDDMLLGVTCSVAIGCDNVTVTSYSSNCNGSLVNIPLSTTTTTTTYLYGNVDFENTKISYSLDNVTDTIGIFYTISGSFPISTENSLSGTFTRPVSTQITCQISTTEVGPIYSVTQISLYKNGVQIDVIQFTTGAGSYSFAPFSFGSGDDIRIVLEDAP